MSFQLFKKREDTLPLGTSSSQFQVHFNDRYRVICEFLSPKMKCLVLPKASRKLNLRNYEFHQRALEKQASQVTIENTLHMLTSITS